MDLLEYVIELDISDCLAVKNMILFMAELHIF